jgi:hypothetical protein
MFCSWARMAGLSQSSRVLGSDGDHGRVFCFTCSRCPRSAGSPRAASCSLCWLSERRLRNTFVVAASVAALIEAGRRCLPMLHDRLTRVGLFLGTPYESWALRQAYQFAPTADFCRAVLESSLESLVVTQVPRLTWCDLETPDHVARIAAMGTDVPGTTEVWPPTSDGPSPRS